MTDDSTTAELLCDVEGHVAWLTFNRPDSLNSFSPAMLRAARRAIDDAEHDPQIRVVVLTGAGRAFCAGGNVKAMSDNASADKSDQRNSHSLAMRLTLALNNFSKPVIASVNGVAAGAGFEVALQADLRIASDTAYLKPAALRLGLVPGDGSVFFLSRLVGTAKANEILLLEQEIRAQEALSLGLFNKVVPAGQLRAETAELAEELAAKAPLALAATKRAIKMSVSSNLETVMDYLQLAVRANRATYDHAEGIAAFRERRAANFEGR